LPFIRLVRGCRQLGRVDDLDVARGDARRNARLFHFHQETLIELPVGIRLPLEDVILNPLLLHLHGLHLLLLKRLPKKRLFPKARLVVASDPQNHFVDFTVQTLLEHLHLILEAHHLRVFRLERLRKFHILGFELNGGLLQILDQFVLKDGRKGIKASSLRLLVESLFGHPLGFGLGQRFVQFGQPLHGHIFFFLEGNDIMLGTECLQVLIRSLDLGLQVIELLAQPLFRLLRRYKTGLQVLLNVGGGQTVGDLGRKFGGVRIEMDFDQP